MQIEKALMNDRLHVSKASWKFFIPLSFCSKLLAKKKRITHLPVFFFSIHHIARFIKSGTPIYNSEVPGTTGKKREEEEEEEEEPRQLQSVLRFAQTQLMLV